MTIKRAIRQPVAWAVLGLLTVGCGDEGGPNDPNAGNEVAAEVDNYLAELPTWAAYTADVNGPAQAATATGSPEPLPDQVVDVEQVEEDGTVTVIPDVTYRCTQTPYTLAENPQDVVMYSPDAEILWPGSLIQGKSRKELGSLLGLTIRERNPIRVSIPAFANNDNFREVPQPDQASVAQAVGSMVGGATESGLSSPSTITFEMESYSSEEQFGLSVGVSGRYLGFSASATGDVSRNASENTVTAHFYQKMFEVVVAPPQTPGDFFSADFTQAKLDEQVRLNRMGPDNIPIYISNVVYGRMMMFSFTSSADESDIRATIQAAYDGIGSSAEGRLSVRQQKILETAKIAVTSLGGDAQATLDVIRSGDWSQYFTDEAPLSSAAPLSYTFRNLGDGSIAGVTEATDFNIRSCQAVPATPGTFAYLDPQEETAPFSGGVLTRLADVNGDGRADFVWNQLQSSTNRMYAGISNGDGTFDFTSPVTHPDSPIEGWGNYELEVASVNDDAYADLVWNYLGDDNKTYVALGNGDGTFGFPSPRIHPARGWGGYSFLVGDGSGPDGVGDDLDDLIWVRNRSSSLGVYAGQSQGNSQFDFLSFAQLTGNFSSNWVPSAMNVDGDGDTDITLNALGTSNTTYVVRSSGNGSWTRLGPFTHPNRNWSGYTRLSGDVDGLGSESMIWVHPSNDLSRIYVARWTGSSFSFLPYQDAQYGSNVNVPFQVLTGDVDGDGDADLIWNAREAGANRTYVSLGQGDGTFDFSALDQLHPDTGANWSQYTMYVADVNGDGREDIVWNWPAATNRVYTALGKQ